MWAETFPISLSKFLSSQNHCVQSINHSHITKSKNPKAILWFVLLDYSSPFSVFLAAIALGTDCISEISI